mmetsp:Transcript_70325/g.203948  ORF Transcript_70325/g.203948 Transcript_70325/m.203948 type:complete len:316 (-) Transcript_70325:2-949(-)
MEDERAAELPAKGRVVTGEDRAELRVMSSCVSRSMRQVSEINVFSFASCSCRAHCHPFPTVQSVRAPLVRSLADIGGNGSVGAFGVNGPMPRAGAASTIGPRAPQVAHMCKCWPHTVGLRKQWSAASAGCDCCHSENRPALAATRGVGVCCAGRSSTACAVGPGRPHASAVCNSTRSADDVLRPPRSDHASTCSSPRCGGVCHPSLRTLSSTGVCRSLEGWAADSLPRNGVAPRVPSSSRSLDPRTLRSTLSAMCRNRARSAVRAANSSPSTSAQSGVEPVATARLVLLLLPPAKQVPALPQSAAVAAPMTTAEP